MRPLVPLLVFALAGCHPAVAQLAPLRPSRDWQLADRTLIGDFSRVTSVAAASDRVFITSPSALLVWRPQFQRWEGPFQPMEPGLLSRVFTSLVDPLDNSLWLASTNGWVHYQPDLDSWTSGTVAGAVQAIAFDLNAPIQGLLLRTTAGWQAVSRGAFSASPAAPPARPVGPVSVSELLRENPTLQANSAQIAINAAESKIRDLERQKSELTITTPIAGRLVAPQLSTMQGQYVKRGEEIATVIQYNPLIVRAT